MNVNHRIYSILTLSLLIGWMVSAPHAAPKEIHSKHWIFGYPLGAPESSDLVIRDIYALSSNDTTKIADWVAYRLDQDTATERFSTSRSWQADPWLDPEETLEPDPDDYKGAHDAHAYTRGHLAPLADFRGSPLWRETNYYSNITPQRNEINSGLINQQEMHVRNFAQAGGIVWVMTGPLFETPMPKLPQADEAHQVPSGYWKIIAQGQLSTPEAVRAVAFIFPQDPPDGAQLADMIKTIDEVERRSELDFFWELPDNVEATLESQTGQWPLQAISMQPPGSDSDVPGDVMVIGNRNSRVYHLRGCPGFNQVSEANRVIFPSEAAAQAEGFRRAGNCP